MAHVTQRIWTTGRRKHVAWGYSGVRDGRRVRVFREEWTKEDAERALSEWTLGIVPTVATGESPTVAGMTFGQMVERFLAEKRAEKKRSIDDDEERSRPLLAFFGKDAALSSITTRRVASTAQLGS